MISHEATDCLLSVNLLAAAALLFWVVGKLDGWLEGWEWLGCQCEMVKLFAGGLAWIARLAAVFFGAVCLWSAGVRLAVRLSALLSPFIGLREDVDPVILDGDIVGSIIDHAFKAGYELVVAVDLWLKLYKIP